jgi:DNA gyrase/topoisomerase IV subunit A
LEVWNEVHKILDEKDDKNLLKLDGDDEVVSAKIISKNITEIISVSSNGCARRNTIDEFHISNRGTKGVSISSEGIVDFDGRARESDILIISKTSLIKLKADSLPKVRRGAKGVRTIKGNNICKIFVQ